MERTRPGVAARDHRRVRSTTGGAARLRVLSTAIALILVAGALVASGDEQGQVGMGIWIRRVYIVRPPSSAFPFFPTGDLRTVGSDFASDPVTVSVETNDPEWSLALVSPDVSGPQLAGVELGCTMRTVDGAVLSVAAFEDGRAVLAGNGRCGRFEVTLELTGTAPGKQDRVRSTLMVRFEDPHQSE